MLLLMQGPSVDFILGRIFEDTKRRAYDEVVKGGTVSDPTNWIADEKLKAGRARFLYTQASCELLR
jgi:hypothetical protein